MKQQNVTSLSLINCSKVSDEDFEMLGDSIMEKMIGNRELHEQMDAMIGSKSSESLKEMHIATGKNWLGCGNEFKGMSRSMMSNMMNMMAYHFSPIYYSSLNYIFVMLVLGWILFFISITILVILYLIGKINKRKIKH
jgi:hypothetical protein